MALGTTEVPTDDVQLAKLLRSRDRRDAAVDLDAFDRALRRAAKLELAWERRLHTKAKQSWKTWVTQNLGGAYETAQRHRYVARLQAELEAAGLPLLTGLGQARAIRQHATAGTPLDALRTAAIENGGKLPKAAVLKAILAATGDSAEKNDLPRERVAQALRKAIFVTEHTPQDDVLKAHVSALRCALRGIVKGQASSSFARKGRDDMETLPLEV